MNILPAQSINESTSSQEQEENLTEYFDASSQPQTKPSSVDNITKRPSTMNNTVPPPTEKPPWGWDYIISFKLPESFKSSPTTTTSPISIDLEQNTIPEPDDLGDERNVKMLRSRIEILSRLQRTGFSFSQLLFPSENQIFIRLSLSEDMLKRKAINLGLELQLLPDYGGGYLTFSPEREHCFVNHHLKQDRQCYFSPAERSLIILNVLQSKENWGCNLNLEQLVYDEEILQAFALHSQHEHKQLIRNTVWKRWWDPTWTPPLDDLKDYLGARVSFYFVFASFYTRRLLPLAVLSIPIYITYKTVTNLSALTIIRALFSVTIVLWTTFFLETWKRHNAKINLSWGVNDYSEDTADDTRPQFNGEPRYGFYCQGGFVSLGDIAENVENDIYLPKTPYANPQKQRRMRIESYIVTGLFVVVVGSLTFLLLWFRNDITEYFFTKTQRRPVANAVPGILNGVMISVFDALWRMVSLMLTRRENHRTNQMFENSLIYKRFAFQFVSNYISLFYIAFVRPYLENTCGASALNPGGDCMAELETQLVSLLLTKATIGQISEIGLPFVITRVKQYLLRRSISNSIQNDVLPVSSIATNQYVLESKLTTHTTTLDDYTELVIQFGYLSLFGMAQPICYVIALLNNVVETRSDGYKLLSVCQRVNADDAADIGAWYAVLNGLNILSIATNAGLLVFTANGLTVFHQQEEAGWRWVWMVIAFFGIEHLFLLLKIMMGLLIKDMPRKCHRQLARQQYEIDRHFGEQHKRSIAKKWDGNESDMKVIAINRLDVASANDNNEATL